MRKLGATVVEFGCEPDGRNINVSCGALLPEFAAQVVRDEKCDYGIVLDGDADRLILLDADGQILDGDVCLYVLCRCLAARASAPAGVVGTVMSNEALAVALQQLNIEFVRANVGDRNIARELVARKWQYGSEPSGHILMLDRHGTGDGVIAALGILQALEASGMQLGDVAAEYRPMPSKSTNVKAANPHKVCELLSETVSVEEQKKKLVELLCVLLAPNR